MFHFDFNLKILISQICGKNVLWIDIADETNMKSKKILAISSVLTAILSYNLCSYADSWVNYVENNTDSTLIVGADIVKPHSKSPFLNVQIPQSSILYIYKQSGAIVGIIHDIGGNPFNQNNPNVPFSAFSFSLLSPVSGNNHIYFLGADTSGESYANLPSFYGFSVVVTDSDISMDPTSINMSGGNDVPPNTYKACEGDFSNSGFTCDTYFNPK